MRVEPWIYSLPIRLRSFFRRDAAEDDLKHELRDHLEQQIEANLVRGMSPNEARSAAQRSLGGVSQIEQQCRDARGGHLLGDFFQDVRYGLRQLVRNPGFSVLAIVCLSLGIGANTAVFSWIEGVLFRPYPLVAHQERLFALAGTARGVSGITDLSWPDFVDFRRACTLCEDALVSKITRSTLSLGDRAEVATGSIVSSNYFEAVGVHPMLGRGFEPDEDAGDNAHPVAVISYQLWRSRFHGDPGIIGRTQRLNNVPHTIIGVAPEGFYGTFVGWAMQFWVPVSMESTFEGDGYKLDDRNARWIEGYVRLRPGVTRAQAQQQISSIASNLEKTYPDIDRGRSIGIWALWQTPFNNAGTLLPTLEVMVAVVAFVLLIACANVANLLLVRSFARRHEMSVRLAIGASHARLVRQLLTEGLILSMLGTLGAFLLAFCCRHALVLLLPARSGISMYLPGTIDGRVLAMGAAVCIVATISVGLVPAFHTRDLDLAGTMKSESASVVGPRLGARLRSALIVLQVCLSFILIVGAALLLESLHRIRNTSPGFSTSSVVVTSVSTVAAGYDVPRARIFQDRLMDGVQALPGIDSAAWAATTPLGYRGFSSAPIAVDGYHPSLEEQPSVDYNPVSPGYFVTLGIPLVSGRDFTRNDDANAPLVAIVNRTMATRYWRGQDPVGSRLEVNGHWARVVGVAADSKYDSIRETPRPFFYVPLRQDFVRGPVLNLRTTESRQALTAALLHEVHAIDPNLALYEVITLQEQVNRSTSPQLVAVILVSVLGSLALLLAAIGLYGVMSYAVAQSTRELGLRIALGAGTRNLLRLVLYRGLRLTAFGVLFGAIAAVVLARFMGGLLFNVSPHDPRVYACAVGIALLTTLSACLLPAWRASQTDPARVLRD